MFRSESEEKAIRLAEKLMYETMSKYDPSHDALHVNRVRRTALHIAHCLQSQYPSLQPVSRIDFLVVELSALFHDINDKKYSTEPKSTLDVLDPFFNTLSQQCPELDLVTDGRAALICKIIDNVSWSTESKLREDGGITTWHQTCLELQCVQDADRLDAIGAIGIMRCSAFSAIKNFPLHDPDGKSDGSSAIQHFHDKLLKIKDRLKTNVGRQLGEERHQFMLQFLEMVQREVDPHAHDTPNSWRVGCTSVH